MSRSFSTNCRSRDNLNWRTRCGCSPWAPQLPCTELALMPIALAIIAAVQWVTSPGGSLSVFATVCSCSAAGNAGMRARRVLSCNSPSTPGATKRSCQRHMVTLLLPVCRIPDAICRQQHDACAPHMLLSAVPIRDDRLQMRTIGAAHFNRDPLAHARSPSLAEHTLVRDSYVRFNPLARHARAAQSPSSFVATSGAVRRPGLVKNRQLGA